MINKEQTIRLINEGYTAKEIADMVGYKHVSGVYNLAHKYGLQVAKPSTGKVEAVKEMAKSGMYYEDIAKELGMSVRALRTYCYQNKIEVTLKPRLKNVYFDNNAINTLNNYHDDWEFIGGYTGSDGSMVIRHKKCGFTTRKSCVTIRHANTLKCQLCEAAEREERNIKKLKQKEREKEVRSFKRIEPKQKQQQMKECSACGALFFDSGRRTTCSEACYRAKKNHYYNMKKEQRRKNSWTDDSSSINIVALYERENGICWLCGNKCDLSKDPNDNLYPSIDHVIPISCGGKDKWDNVRLAHRICNSVRGAKEKITFVEREDIPPVGLA